MQQLSGGWIKLHRSLADHGHLQMPDQALKVFIYLLLEVNHTPNAGCAAGEGWITYRRIREACCDPSKPQWSDHTISDALAVLEKGGYIRRIKTKIGAAQRLRIVNWHKYQGQSSAVTAEVRAEVPAGVTAEPRAELSAEKQESQEAQEKKEEEEAPAAQSLSTQGEQGTWVKWHEQKFAVLPSARALQDYGRLTERGVGDDLIIEGIERSLKAKGVKAALPHALSVIGGWFADDIKTLAQLRKAEAAADAEQSASRRSQGGDDQGRPPEEDDDDPITLRAREQAKQLRQVAQRGADADHEDPRDRIRQKMAAQGSRPMSTDEIE